MIHDLDTEKAKPSPIFCLLSLSLPLVGIPFAITMAKYQNGPVLGFGALTVFMFVSCLTLMFGILSACVALRRCEKFRFLVFLGFIANVATFLWLLHAVSGQ
jgi:hypothetical protein